MTVVPISAWWSSWAEAEANLAATVGVSTSQLQFILSFFASFPLSAALNSLESTRARHIYSVIVGLALLYYPFGASIVHLAPPCIVIYLAMLSVPRHAGTVAWAVAMPCLIYWHEAGASGTAWREGKMDFTGALMVLTLKLISSATNLSDNFKGDKNLRVSEKEWRISKAPGPLEYASYLLAVGNLLAGPHIHIKTYLQFMERKGLWDVNAPKRMPNPVVAGFWHFAQSIACLVLHLGLTHLGFGISTFTSDRFFSLPFYGRFVFTWLIGFTTRWKYYFVWSLAHSGMVISGLSFEGFDRDGNPMWERGCNQNILGLELCGSGAEVPLNWNIQTGMWLRYYCYDRLTPIGKKPGFLPLLLTQLVCSMWHGLFIGYMMFFSGSALMVFASRVIYGFQKHLKGLPRTVAVALHTFFTSLCLNFLASAFQLLTWEESVAVWQSLYYLPLVLMIIICLIGPMIPRPRKSDGHGSNRETSETQVHVHGTNGDNGIIESNGSMLQAPCSNGHHAKEN